MKKTITILVLLITCMSAMAQDSTEPLETIYQKFAFTLFNKVAEDGNKNVILSPFSAQIALSMVQNGAANNTLAEIQEAMGTTGYTNEQVNAYNQQLTERLTYRPPFSFNPSYQTEEEAREQYDYSYPVFETANGIWASIGESLLDEYKEQMTTIYDAEVGNVDFGAQQGIDYINGWVSDKTHQHIPSILDEPDGNIAVLLANALYFNGCWTTPFDSDLTETAKFHLADGKTMDVDMMKTEEIYCRTTTSEKFNTVTLPYGKGDFSMTIFLPTENQSIPQLTYDDWLLATDANAPIKDFELRMPKFEIEGKYDMVDLFKSLGMEEAFTGSADFSRMSNFGLFIGDIFQSGKICVNEKGTEAAAVTVIIMGRGNPSPPETFVVDHPFYFTLENNATHTILFMGRMMEISSSAGSPQGIKDIPVTPTTDHKIYDLQGRALQQAPTKGVYIQDGKKYIK